MFQLKIYLKNNLSPGQGVKWLEIVPAQSRGKEYRVSLQEELAGIIAAEEKRLGVGSEEFLRKYNELKSQIDALEKTRLYVTAKDVAEALGVSQTKAYSIIRELNSQLKANGYIVISGKVNRKFFEEKCLYSGR